MDLEAELPEKMHSTSLIRDKDWSIYWKSGVFTEASKYVDLHYVLGMLKIVFYFGVKAASLV